MDPFKSENAHGHCFKDLVTLLNGVQPKLPSCVATSAQKARPGYGRMDASEYLDHQAELQAKIHIVANMLRSSSNAVVYTGAGISTSSGVDDYASQASDSVVRVKLSNNAASPFLAEPTIGHKALARLIQKGVVKRWFNQNHDGLAQKAGVPQGKINEIHGSWYDPSNPVVKMSGRLRPDLVSDLQSWQNKVDVCLALGTSLSGMTADSLALSTAKTKGLVIVNIQRTPYDHLAAVRIFAKLDDVLERLANILHANESPPLPFKPSENDENSIVIPLCGSDLPLDTTRPSLANSSHVSKKAVSSNDDSESSSSSVSVSATHASLDLRPGAEIYIHGGPYNGSKGEVDGCNAQGHFNLRVWVVINQKTGFKAPTPLKLGSWWVDAALQGSHIPISNHPPSSNS